MPRPKVHPDARQRSVIACVPCKTAKIRCDSKTPCSTCIKRSRETQCVYEHPSPNGASRRKRRSTTVNSSEAPKPLHPVSYDDTHVTSSSSADGNLSVYDESQGPQSRMLLSSKFQRVYIGETSSLSYLEFVRRIVQHRIGPCPFTEGDFKNFMLESNVASGSPEALVTMTQEERRALAQAYLEGTSGILDFGNTSDVFAAVENTSTPDKYLGMATSFLILAIGAQCRGSLPSDLKHAATFFSQGQQLAFQDMLRDPSLDMVRNFLLMAFAMLGMCHRNAAFMYLGVAAKAASALGLHRTEQYRDMAPDECRIRMNTWKSLRVIDTIYNSILGRPGSLPTTADDSRFERISQSCGIVNSPRQTALQAAYDLCPFLDELEAKHCIQDTPSTENFLQRLQQWSKALPPEMRQGTEAVIPTAMSTDHELLLGGTQVACNYYFAVILATRRFLTLYILDQLKVRSSNGGAGPASQLDDKTISLAYVSLNAAISLTKVVYNAIVTEGALNMMCLVKAWVFAAGLLLGFSSFAQGTSSGWETDEAFRQSRSALEKLAQFSPQAGHYYEILTSLSDAIGIYQRKLSDDRRRMTSQYMDQIFTSDANKPAEEPTLSTNVDTTMDLPSNGLDSWNVVDGLETGNLASIQMTPGPYGTVISEGFPWPADDFQFDWNTYAPFLDDIF